MTGTGLFYDMVKNETCLPLQGVMDICYEYKETDKSSLKSYQKKIFELLFFKTLN